MAFKFKDLSILIVDDDPTIREITCAVLKKLDFKLIESSADGSEAFKKFQKNNHDLLVVDWQMAPVNGIELIKMIRDPQGNSPNPKVPIIFASGYTNPEMVSEARDSGVNEFLVKPYSTDDLIKRIVYVVNKPRKFISLENFFGPDRRRQDDPNYSGPDRRKGEQ